jgi:hypothetical protein
VDTLPAASAEEMLNELKRRGTRGIVVSLEAEKVIKCFSMMEPMRASFFVATDAATTTDAATVEIARALLPIIPKLDSVHFFRTCHPTNDLAQRIATELGNRGRITILFEMSGSQEHSEIRNIYYSPNCPASKRNLLVLSVASALGKYLEKLGPDGGYIYVLVNSSMPDLCKIGMTTRTPEERAAELSKTTGVATPFIVAYYTQVADCSVAERRIHERLAYARVRSGREFFRMDATTAIEIIRELCE